MPEEHKPGTPDPPSVGRFVFAVDSIPASDIGAFTECSGLTVEVQVEEVIEGGNNTYVHRLPGRLKWPNIVLKRGITNNDALLTWFRQCTGDGFGNVSRTTGSIVLKDPAGKDVRRWDFEGAFPVKWSGPKFATGTNAAATEELEIAHNGFRTT